MLLLCEVYRAKASDCYLQEAVQVSQTSGYLASIVTEETGCGSTTTPWQIVAKAGQRINFTLYDFGVANSTSSATDVVTSILGTTQCQVL